MSDPAKRDEPAKELRTALPMHFATADELAEEAEHDCLAGADYEHCQRAHE
jgi:hypothetical protein